MIKAQIEQIGGLRVCRCETGICVHTMAFPQARFVAEKGESDWRRVIREGRVDFDDLCQLGKEQTE